MLTFLLGGSTMWFWIFAVIINVLVIPIRFQEKAWGWLALAFCSIVYSIYALVKHISIEMFWFSWCVIVILLLEIAKKVFQKERPVNERVVFIAISTLIIVFFAFKLHHLP
jgi:hypothetical protein